MSKDEARQKLAQSRASSSSSKVLGHWLKMTEPWLAFELALAAYSNNVAYIRLKRGLGYVCW